MVPSENACRKTAVGKSPGFETGLRVRYLSIILCRSSGSPKISRVGFEIVDISEGGAGSAGVSPAVGTEPAGGAEPAGGVEPAGGIGSGETVTGSVGNAGAGVAKYPFEVFEDS